MYISAHAAAGVALASTTGNIGVAFIVGMMSHFLLDVFPHGDTRANEVLHVFLRKKSPGAHEKIFHVSALIDALLLLALTAFVFFRVDAHPYVIAAGILGSIFPDLMMGILEIVEEIPNLRQSALQWLLIQFHRVHYATHWVFPDPPYLVGLAVQALFLVVLLRILLL